MKWQPPPNNEQQYFNMLMGYFNPFDVTSAIKRWPHINWPQMMLNIADGTQPLLADSSYTMQATPI